MADVVIVGAGVGGTLTAALLHRQGLDVTLIDARHPCPPTFKCEFVGKDQAERLRRMGFLDLVAAHSTPITRVTDAWMGTAVSTGPTEHYGILYHDLVNLLRGALPEAIDFRTARVTSISTGDDGPTVELDQGETLRPKLVVLTTGHAPKLLTRLGLTRNIVSPSHSVSLGMTIEATEAAGFSFQDMTYWGDREDSDIALATFFPVAEGMRLNVFAYWTGDDPRIAEIADAPAEALFRLMPGLKQVTGDFRVTGRIDRFALNLYRTEGPALPGIVLTGDAYSAVCPTTGTGLTKVLNDVEILAGTYAAKWLEAGAISAEDIAQFYGDERKRKVDAETAALTMRMRRTAKDTALKWRLRRTARRLKRRVWKEAAVRLKRVA
ncbi:2-polyprenyl-6-methoxyphenol hydroxylase-like FAD-dependent oxidoreductase [Rhodobium orientis]|nr:FAD-dependent monooxygenase [Rhodobium orientis]MBB4304834.1 2-polyprenyl-6-methoxyphenol hydroxylase-like FAD-dependent oxidoreductase [Rhodobium orientis]